jgi:actin-related protein
MTLLNESQIENPERDTAGLASATQLIDFTASDISISINTSLAPLNYIPLQSFQEEEELSRSRNEEHKTRHEIFKQALRQSMRRESRILDELAKY